MQWLLLFVKISPNDEFIFFQLSADYSGCNYLFVNSFCVNQLKSKARYMLYILHGITINNLLIQPLTIKCCLRLKFINHKSAFKWSILNDKILKISFISIYFLSIGIIGKQHLALTQQDNRSCRRRPIIALYLVDSISEGSFYSNSIMDGLGWRLLDLILTVLFH